jgi:hypothetical protein
LPSKNRKARVDDRKIVNNIYYVLRTGQIRAQLACLSAIRGLSEIHRYVGNHPAKGLGVQTTVERCV